jgi:hypothetical protein
LLDRLASDDRAVAAFDGLHRVLLADEIAGSVERQSVGGAVLAIFRAVLDVILYDRPMQRTAHSFFLRSGNLALGGRL